MFSGQRGDLIKITKYPNRRFYDSTRRAHVTLDNIYQLVIEGHDVEVTDSRTGDDITNVVLTQILLDRDPPKLELVPASVLHYTLRSNRQMLRAFLDRFFGPLISNFAAYQRQFDHMIRQSASNPMLAPAWDWAEQFMKMFNAGAPESAPEVTPNGSSPDHSHPAAPATPEPSEQVSLLREEVSRLRQQVATLNRESRGGPRRPSARKRLARRKK